MSDHELGVCPYNSQHKILLFRLPTHIIKCAAKYRGPPLEICEYNATHRVRPELMEAHLRDCAEYHKFNRASYVKFAETERQQSTPIQQVNNCPQEVREGAYGCYATQTNSTWDDSTF